MGLLRHGRRGGVCWGVRLCVVRPPSHPFDQLEENAERGIEQSDEDWLTPFEEDITTSWDFTAIHINTISMDVVNKDLVRPPFPLPLKMSTDLVYVGLLLGYLWQQTHLGNRIRLRRQSVPPLPSTLFDKT